MGLFDAWGYDEVVVPSLEYYDVLRRGLSDDERRRSVRFVEGRSGKLVTLRADVTPQIARVVAQRLAPRVIDAEAEGGGGTQSATFRVSYAADVVRLPESARQRSEIHQVGVEYVGPSEPLADAELVCLLHAALTSLGLRGFRIELAHMAVIRDSLRTLELDESLVSGEGARALSGLGLAGHLARKDGRGLDDALSRHGVGDKQRKAFVSLVDAFGAPQPVLDAAAKSLRPLKVKKALARLAEVVSLVGELDDEAAAALALDLGEVRGFDYYTGVRLRVWAPGVAEPLVRGGRYDEMTRRYGLDLPATGFAIDLDALERALAHGDVSVETGVAAGHCFAHPTGADRAVQLRAMRAATSARRERTDRTWVCAAASVEAAKVEAQRARAARLTWFGSRPVEYRRTSQGWSRETTKAQPRKGKKRS